MMKHKKGTFSPDEYFKSLYTTCPYAFENAKSAEDCANISCKIKSELSAALAIDKIPFKCDSLEAEELWSEKRKSYLIEALSVTICKGLKMLCYVLIPKKSTGSGIVALCGHGYGCRQIIRQGKNGKYRRIDFLDGYQKNFAEALALKGHTVIVPELIGFGEARLKKDMRKPFYASSCETVSHHSLLYGFSTASLRVYQAMRCVDILKESFSCESIGCMGISGGGLVALYTACLDERIDRVCVCGYINTFKTSILNMWHCSDNYIPGIMNIGEMYDFASAVAPRKLMMECGENDRLFPISGSREAIEKITSVYEMSGAAENFIPVIFKGKHEVSLESAVDFFSL